MVLGFFLIDSVAGKLDLSLGDVMCLIFCRLVFEGIRLHLSCYSVAGLTRRIDKRARWRKFAYSGHFAVGW